jgi:outer membrane protein assembly factor BamB
VSFDLAVLAVDASVDVSAARQMFESCSVMDHAEGEPNEWIVLFYEQLRAVFPDSGPESAGHASPWMSTPLSVGIDHVIMHVRFGPVGTSAIETTTVQHSGGVHPQQNATRLLIAGLAVTAILSGDAVGMSSTRSVPLAAGDWPTYHKDNARTGEATDLAPLGTLAVAWQSTLDGAVFGQPLVVGGTILAATENDTIYALDPARRHPLADPCRQS